MLGLIETAPRCRGVLAGPGGEIGQFRERQVELARRAAHAEILDGLDEIIGEIFRVDELQEGPLGIGRREDDFGIEFLAALERDTRAARPRTLDDDLRNRTIDPDLGPQRSCRVGDGAADPAGAALGETPGAEGAVDLAHVVMQQHVSRPRRARTEEGADDAAGGLGAFERVGLEPLLEQVRGGLRDQLGDGVQFLFGQPRRVLASLSSPIRSRGCSDEGSGGTRLMSGLMALAARAMTRAYSS
jgi:hypothetical protein